MNFLKSFSNSEPTEKQKIEAVEQKRFEELLEQARDERAKNEREEKVKIIREYQEEIEKRREENKEKIRKAERDIEEKKKKKVDELENLKKENEKEFQKLLGDLKQKTEEEKEEIKNKGLRTIKEKKAVLDNKEEQISQLSRPINEVKLLEEYKLQLLAEEKEEQDKVIADCIVQNNENKKKLEEIERKKKEWMETIEETAKKLASELRTEKNSHFSFALEMKNLEMKNRYDLTEAYNGEEEFDRFQNDCNSLIDAFTEFEHSFDSENGDLLMTRDDIEDGVKSMCDLANSLLAIEAFAIKIGEFNKEIGKTGNSETIGKSLEELTDNLKSLLTKINNKSERYNKNFDNYEITSAQSKFSIKELYEEVKKDIATIKKKLSNLHTRHENVFDKLLKLQMEDLNKRAQELQLENGKRMAGIGTEP